MHQTLIVFHLNKLTMIIHSCFESLGANTYIVLCFTILKHKILLDDQNLNIYFKILEFFLIEFYQEKTILSINKPI